MGGLLRRLLDLVEAIHVAVRYLYEHPLVHEGQGHGFYPIDL